MTKAVRWLWLPLIFGIILAGYYSQTRARGAAAAKSGDAAGRAGAARATPVGVSAAARSDFGVYLTGLGTVTPFNTVTVKSLVDGELIKVAFEEGQLVREGDLLAEIDPRPFEVQLDQAQGQLAKDEAQVGQAEANLVRDTAQEKYARTEADRYARLVEQGVIPLDQGEESQSKADALAGTLTADRAAIGSAKAQVLADQAAIHNINLQLTYSRIKSPITGRIGLRLVDKGNIIRTATQNGIAVITQLQPISVIFNIAEDHLPEVLKRMQGRRLAVELWDRDRMTMLAGGTLATIDNQIDQTSGTVRFKAVVPNENGRSSQTSLSMSGCSWTRSMRSSPFRLLRYNTAPTPRSYMSSRRRIQLKSGKCLLLRRTAIAFSLRAAFQTVSSSLPTASIVCRPAPP